MIVRAAVCDWVLRQVVFAVVVAAVLTLHEMRPKDAELIFISGSPHCGWFRALGISARSVNATFSRICVLLPIPIFTTKWPGPVRKRRPNVPTCPGWGFINTGLPELSTVARAP